nr:ribonuclease H-like domain-containing protein [Tanacetum cinerariifolium]
MVVAAKLSVLNPNEFELWKMRIEQYFLMTYYAFWEVILNGDSPLPTRIVEGVETPYPPTSVEEKLARKNKLKAREGLDQIYDRLQKLINQLEIHKETISQEDLNMKLLKSLPCEWKTHTLIWRNKPDLKTLSMNDLYNNLKIYEAEVMGSSSTTQNTQNLAFVSSNNTDSTNKAVNTAHGECMAFKHQDNNMVAPRRTMLVEDSTSNALVSQCDGLGYDWSDQAKDGPTNFALMAYTSSSSSSTSNSNTETSAKVKTINEDVRLQALVDGKKVIVNEASIRRDLILDDAEGTACLPNAAIFEESAIMRYEKPSQKLTFYKAFFSPQWRVLSLEQTKTNQVDEIEKLKKRVKKLKGMKKKRTHGLKRLYKVGLSARIVSFDEEGLDDQEDASKQKRITEIDADEDLSLINETAQDLERINDQDLFGVHDLDGDEVIVNVTASENVEQDATVAEKEVSTADDEVVTTADDAEITTAATTSQISKDDVTLAQTLIKIKAAKHRARGSIAREKDEANIALIEEWDDVQAIIDADRQLAEQIQAQEREQLSIKERSKLLAELIESRRKYFAAKRDEEIKNKPPTKAQQKSLMLEKSLKKTQAEVTKGSSKRAGDEIEQESAKRQRLGKEDDTAKLKICLELVPEDDDDVAIEATPLSFKSATIVDYKIYKEGKKSYFRIIRADGNSQNYLTFEKMFKNFNREDLEVLRSIVKERFKKAKPVDDMDNLLFQTLRTMFEHQIKDNIWKYQQGTVKVYNWKLFYSCGVYCVTTQNMVYYLLVKKMYQFTNNILYQLWKYVKLQVDYEVEMAYDLLRLIRRQINEGYIPA